MQTHDSSQAKNAQDESAKPTPSIAGSLQLAQQQASARRSWLLAVDTTSGKLNPRGFHARISHVICSSKPLAESDAAVAWGLLHLLRHGDNLHLLYLVPGLHADHAFSLPAGGRLMHFSHTVDQSLAERTQQAHAALSRQLLQRYKADLAARKISLHVHVLPQAGVLQ
jgi:hypothetical protein